MSKAPPIGPERVVAFGDLVLDLQRIRNDSLAGAILVVRCLGRRFDPRKILLADFHHAFGQRRREQGLRDVGAQLLETVVHFRFAHGGLGFGYASGQLRSSPQWQLLLDTIGEIAVFLWLESFVAVNAAAEHRHRVFPRADALGVERSRANARISSLERRIVRARFANEPIDVVRRDDDNVRRRDGLRIFSGPAIQQGGGRDQNSSKEFHGRGESV